MDAFNNLIVLEGFSLRDQINYIMDALRWFSDLIYISTEQFLKRMYSWRNISSTGQFFKRMHQKDNRI